MRTILALLFTAGRSPQLPASGVLLNLLHLACNDLTGIAPPLP